MSAYDRMCEAISICAESFESDLARLPTDEQFRVCQVISQAMLENKVAEIRLRAERSQAVLLRDAAGLPPRNKRDAKWLANWGGATS